MTNWSSIAWRSPAYTLVAIVTLFCPVWAAEKHSGTIVSMDKTASALVIEEVGPWPGGPGQTAIANLRIRVTGETRFVRAERRARAGSAGWPGGLVEVSLAAWGVREGDYITVAAERVGDGLVALEITVMRP